MGATAPTLSWWSRREARAHEPWVLSACDEHARELHLDENRFVRGLLPEDHDFAANPVEPSGCILCIGNGGPTSPTQRAVVRARIEREIALCTCERAPRSCPCHGDVPRGFCRIAPGELAIDEEYWRHEFDRAQKADPSAYWEIVHVALDVAAQDTDHREGKLATDPIVYILEEHAKKLPAKDQFGLARSLITSDDVANEVLLADKLLIDDLVDELTWIVCETKEEFDEMAARILSSRDERARAWDAERARILAERGAEAPGTADVATRPAGEE